MAVGLLSFPTERLGKKRSAKETLADGVRLGVHLVSALVCVSG